MERLAALADPLGLLQAIFASAPVGLQIYERSGRCLIVNAAHTRLFGGVPPPEYNIFEDNLLVERGIVDLVRRAFAGERVAIPAIWYDIRELRNLPPSMDVSGGRRVAIASEMVPLRATKSDEVTHVLIVFNDVTEEHEARERSEAAARAAEERAAQSALLADAGRLLSSSLDLDVTLAKVATLATTSLCDICVIDMVNDDGTYRRVAAVHRDPALQPALDDLRTKYPPIAGSTQPSVVAIASRKPDLNSELDPELIGQRSTSPAHRDLLVRVGMRSQLTVPLLVGDQVLGAIVLGHSRDRRFTERDIPFMEALASHAAVAIENARLFRAAQLARTEAEAANRAKDEFLAMLGHELRNPLAPIVTALELTRIRDGQSRERAIIERQVQHLRRLVDDLLDVSRITRGSLDLDRTTVDLADPINEGIDLARPLVEQRRHTLDIDVPRDLFVHGDRTRLAQIVANLITNAARYTEPGGKITISAARSGGAIALRVRDTGVGMPPDLLAHVFETFTRGARPIDRAAGGLGLGLAIVKSLATLHGGSVVARSEGPGHGSEFEVTLPAHNNVDAPRATPDRASSPTITSAGAVLVVDDNLDAAELLVEGLVDRGFTAVIAHSAFEALELAAQHHPKVALVDIGLPGMDGFELARRLRADPQHAKLALVALTGYGQPSDRERTREVGFVEHLVKPVSLDVIVPIVELLLAQ